MANNFDFPWVKFLGMQVVEASDGRCVARLEPKPEHFNHNGTVNAPILFGAAEYTGGSAVAAGMMHLLTEAYLVAKEANIQYLAPARGSIVAAGTVDPADYAAAKEAVAQGKPADLTAVVELTGEDDRLAARVTLTMAIRPKRG